MTSEHCKGGFWKCAENLEAVCSVCGVVASEHPRPWRRKPWWRRMKAKLEYRLWLIAGSGSMSRFRVRLCGGSCPSTGDCDFPSCSPFVWNLWWQWLFRWDRWIGNDPVGGYETAVLKIKHLVHLFGWRIDLHCFIAADGEGCFHTHPAMAVRVVLCGGYEEEIWDRRPWNPSFTCLGSITKRPRDFDLWLPGSVGIIRPEFAHRVHRLANGKSSYSLWFRGPITHDIHILGPGYDEVLASEEGKARVSHVKEY